MANGHWRGAARRVGLGLAAVLGFRPRGFFVPYRHAEDVTHAPYPAIAALLAAREADFANILDAIDSFERELLAIPAGAPAPAARWNQDWFPRLDAAAAYAVVRTRRPRLVVEVGSGHSTRFLLRAAEDGGLNTRIVAIDPAPRAPFASARIEHIPSPLERADAGIFERLGAGDILFIDSSHVLMPGTDVDILLNRVLPGLPSGVVVHVHDMFLPDPYPESWRWRGYNEQTALAALIHGGGYVPLFSSRYAATRMGPRLARGATARLPLPEGAHETSLWLEKR
ncbi:MAG: class I SAM-dependent methyltransferase [Alphaproteobacteria bacterium]